MKKISLICLTILWIVISLWVRIVGLEKSPISVGFDEASLGYNAYSLYLTGKDEYGTPHPLSLRSFNDFKPALYAYLAVPFIYFFDLNQTSVRLPSAVLGTISLVFLLLIFKKLSKTSYFLSLISVAFISFLPWRLHFSRVAFESNVSMAFFTGMVWCVLSFNKNLWYKVGTVAFSTLAIYSYHGARLAVPVFLFFALTDSIPNLKSLIKNPASIFKKLWPLWLVLGLYIPMFIETSAANLLTRLSQTNVFNHYYPFTPSELVYGNSPWTNILANPLYYFTGILTGHVFAYLSPQNLSLLLYPGVIRSAQVISGSGMLGWLGGILFVVGLATSLKAIFVDKEKRVLVYWFLAGIVPAIISWEWFYPLRSLNIYPALEVAIGFGIIWTIRQIQKTKSVSLKILSLIPISLTAIVSSIYNINNEFNYGAWDTNGEFQPGGYKEGAPVLLSLIDKYDTVYIDTAHAQNYTMFWFYLKYPPQKVHALANIRNKPGTQGPPTFDYDKFVYKKFSWPEYKDKNSFIFWTSSEVKDEEIKSTPGANLYRIQGPLGNWPVTIVTKE